MNIRTVTLPITPLLKYRSSRQAGRAVSCDGTTPREDTSVGNLCTFQSNDCGPSKGVNVRQGVIRGSIQFYKFNVFTLVNHFVVFLHVNALSCYAHR